MSLIPPGDRQHLVPAGVLGYGDGDIQPQRRDPLANRVHVDNGIDALGATFDTTLRARAETAVVQTFITDVVAALLQSHGRGHPRNTHVNHQLQEEKK